MSANGKSPDSIFSLMEKAENPKCVMGLLDPTHFILQEYQGEEKDYQVQSGRIRQLWPNFCKNFTNSKDLHDTLRDSLKSAFVGLHSMQLFHLCEQGEF